jgi:hypothetical protein
MQYGEIISRSFTIMWRHRYLWLLAILGGADVGSGGFTGGNPASFSNLGNNSSGAPDPGQFLQDHLGVIVVTGILVLLFFLAIFILSCVTTGALVRASAEHDAERPFGLGMAWRAGLGTFWSILALRLIGLVWVLVILAAIGTFVLLGFATYSSGSSAALAGVISLGILVGIVLVVVSIPVGLVFILAARAIVLEQRGAVAGLVRGFQLLRARLGRTLLAWLVQVAVGIGAQIVVGILFLIVFLIAAVPIVAAYFAAGTGSAVLVGIPVGLVVLAILLLVTAINGAYFSTFWTLAFRRLELETPPAPAYPPTAYPPYQPPPYRQPPA